MTEKASAFRLTCLKCHERLIEKKVVFNYLNCPVSTKQPCCPSCGQIYLSEEFVMGKLNEVEKTLEDK